MRISTQEKRTPHHRFAARTDEWVPKEHLEHRGVIHVGLVGGCDLASIAARQAQSILRFDRRPSYFSHAFIFSGRGSDIFECRVIDADPGCPENNGVWRSSADRYADAKAFPNRALISFRFKSHQRRRSAVLDRAKNPNASVERIDLWSLVTDWQAYLFDPHRYSNPLLDNLSHPGALFVNWVLDAGGIDVTMGASEPTDAPEHIWAAANWWSEAYASEDFDVDVSIRKSIRHRDCGIPRQTADREDIR